MSDLSFSEFHPSRLSEQRELFCRSFPETINGSIEKEEHYHWKFSSFPSEKPSFQYIADLEQKMLGYYAAIPYPYKIGQNRATCGMVCDVMTHPEARGKGVFTKIGKYSTDAMKDEGLDFTSGYPIRPAVIPGHVKVGWKVAFDLPMFICPLKLDDALKQKKLGFAAPFFNFFLSILHSTSRLMLNLRFSKLKKQYKVDSKELHDCLKEETTFTEFVNKWTEQNQFCLIKDKKFLSWRFSAPKSKYQVLQIKEGENIVAVAITRCVELKGINTLAILDIMIDHDHFDVRHLLLDKLKSLARNLKQNFIAGICTRSWYRKYGFLHHFYFKSPVIFKFIYKVLNPKYSQLGLDKEENWHLMWIDSDDL